MSILGCKPDEHTGKISIIAPVYNVEKFLAKCIDSILDQDYVNFELILVDDGSTDRSGEICDLYSSKDSRIKMVHKPNGGVSSARNAGINASTGDWITFIDPDDYVDPGFLSEAVSDFKDDPDLIIFGFRYVYADNRPLFEAKCVNDYLETPDFIKRYFIDFYKNKIMNASIAKVYKASIIKAEKIMYNEQFSICEDGLFVSDYLYCCKRIKCVGKAFYNYVQHDSPSLMKRFNKNALKAKETFVRSQEKMLVLLQSEDSKPILQYIYASAGHFYISEIIHLFNRYSGDRKSRYEMLKEYTQNRMFRSCLRYYRPNSFIRKLIKFMICVYMTPFLYLMLEIKNGRNRAKTN